MIQLIMKILILVLPYLFFIICHFSYCKGNWKHLVVLQLCKLSTMYTDSD